MTDYGMVLDAHLRKEGDRGDEKFVHISDLYGCDRATWARRKGEPQLPFLPSTLVKFAMGKDIEERFGHALRADYPGDSEEQVRIMWRPDTGDCIALDEGAEPLPGYIVGHIDVELADDDRIVEVKSTSFYMGREPKECEEHYEIQAAGYTVARGHRFYSVFVIDRSSGKTVTFHFDLSEAMRSYITQRAKQVLRLSDPSKPMPEPTEGRQKWACKTCRFAGCNLNVNPARAMVLQ